MLINIYIRKDAKNMVIFKKNVKNKKYLKVRACNDLYINALN